MRAHLADVNLFFLGGAPLFPILARIEPIPIKRYVTWPQRHTKSGQKNRKSIVPPDKRYWFGATHNWCGRLWIWIGDRPYWSDFAALHLKFISILIVSITHLFVKGTLQMQLTWWHNEFFADLNRWLVTRLAWCVHDFPDGKSDWVPFVWLVFGRLADKCLQLVVYTTWFSGVPWMDKLNHYLYKPVKETYFWDSWTENVKNW